MRCRLVAVSDKNKSEPAARSAGRGVGWLLKKLIGREPIAKVGDSARALRDEYEAGRRDAEPKPPRTVPHEVKKSEPPPPED